MVAVLVSLIYGLLFWATAIGLPVLFFLLIYKFDRAIFGVADALYLRVMGKPRVRNRRDGVWGPAARKPSGWRALLMVTLWFGIICGFSPVARLLGFH